ncbi:MAG TPA: hypothetical protein VNK95_06765, partial [Caldilineaceae bacterium]|nr:hypothetical protein [Caldilineaceae bacterium]
MPPYQSSRALGSQGLRGLAPLMRGQSLPVIALAAGLLLGLLLGLLIGWVLWPVQWTNAWPQDLSPEARAQYLAAVAEAYVYRGDEQAAEAARNRLYDLNENLAAEIAAAQAFFAENPQPNSSVHINNLGQLAQALNVQSPDIITDAPPVEEGAAVSAPATEDSAVGSRVRN